MLTSIVLYYYLFVVISNNIVELSNTDTLTILRNSYVG